jgi:hypothetical protein
MQNNIDELPIGGSSGPTQMPDEFGAESNAAAVDNKGPLEERVLSKNWSVRAAAFEELTQAFKQASSPNDQIFKDHSGSWKKYLSDTNPGALEKALDALEVFID